MPRAIAAVARGINAYRRRAPVQGAQVVQVDAVTPVEG